MFSRILRGYIVVRIPALMLLALMFCAAPPGHGDGPETMTPLLLDIQDAPLPFMGSDGRVHLVYELWVTNFSSADVVVEKVEVLDGATVLSTLDASAVAARLQPAGVRSSTGTLSKSTQ